MSDTKEINQMKKYEIKDTDRYEILYDCSGLNETEKKKFISNVIFYYLYILKMFFSHKDLKMKPNDTQINFNWRND